MIQKKKKIEISITIHFKEQSQQNLETWQICNNCKFHNPFFCSQKNKK